MELVKRVATDFRPIIDPRAGDVEDDVSSTKTRKLAALAGSMLAEISLPKFILAWTLLVGLPGLCLGLAPLVASAWLTKISDKIAALTGLGSLLLFAILAAVGFYGIRPLFRLVERSFWSLHALAVQPVYALCREGLSQFAEGFLEPDAAEHTRSRRRARTAAAAGLLACGIAVAIALLVWPHTRWTASLAELSAPMRLVTPALANAVSIVGAYLAVASLVWGISDATMDQPQRLAAFNESAASGPASRIAHLSDVHVVGERYGFRIESGRAGPQGNERLSRLLNQLDAIHQAKPIDSILLTGDMTDAGRSSEWAEFLGRTRRLSRTGRSNADPAREP